MCPFETFDHTADVGLRVRAETLDELFAEAARGLFSVLLENPEAVERHEMVELQLHAEDLAYLLADWLRELLYIFDTQHLVFSEFQVKVNERRYTLSALCSGEPLDWSRHRPGTEVKAVTYHGLRVEKHGEEWLAEVILDI